MLFLDDDAELEPGALDLLVNELDAHPQVVGVTCTVVLPNGTVQHSGGWLRDSGDIAEFGLVASGSPISQELPPSGPADWIPGGAALFRREAFAEFAIDTEMNAYFEDNEWCYRVERARPGSFRRSREARIVHHQILHSVPAIGYLTRSHTVEMLSAYARFYRRHGKLLDGALFDLVPELNDLHGGHDLAAARLLMELVDAKGQDWTFMEWMNGGLERLLGAGRALSIAHARIAECERTIEGQQAKVGYLEVCDEKLWRIENGGWWRLRGRLQPFLRLLARLRGTAQQ